MSCPLELGREFGEECKEICQHYVKGKCEFREGEGE